MRVCQNEKMLSKNQDNEGGAHLHEEVLSKIQECDNKYAEILKKIDDCAKGLYDCGVRKGDVVTLCLPNTLEGIVSFFAINKIGAIVNFIHPASGENEIKNSVNAMDSRVIIAIDSNYSKIESIVKDTKIQKVILVSINDYMPFINKLRYNKNKVLHF